MSKNGRKNTLILISEKKVREIFPILLSWFPENISLESKENLRIMYLDIEERILEEERSAGEYYLCEYWDIIIRAIYFFLDNLAVSQDFILSTDIKVENILNVISEHQSFVYVRIEH